ncbi:MAG TPA: hypothetical protein VFA94_00535 [Acidimicrobiales bacterium]|nr:hypothetical protein [Acidimicrobiales bacterium]
MARTVVRHHVQDYDAWRRVYDDVAPLQKEGGVFADSVYRDKDDPLEVLVIHDFGTMAEAVAFFNNPDLADAMKRAGVDSAPRIEFYEEA